MTGPLLLGVRHHGPGSARAVRAALERTSPAVVLIEGPPEGDALLPLAADERMRPPVALLAHAVDDPGRSAFWPLAEFSPEWAAIRWALGRGVPVRFIDLPAAHTLARPAEEDEETPADRPRRPVDAAREGRSPSRPASPGDRNAGGAVGHRAATDPGWGAFPAATGRGPEARCAGPAVRGGGPAVDPGWDAVPSGEQARAGQPGGAGARGVREGGEQKGAGQPDGARGRGGEERIDPLAALAAAAGYDDPERWWEDVVEHRGGQSAEGDPLAPFDALAEAMGALRSAHGHGGHERDLPREAHMRLRLRAACKEFGEDRVAVVCGAWHVPALRQRTTVAADRALLKGLPRVRTETTWVPWTHRRLARRSGYGAGIESPGWYAHLFRSRDRPVERWMTKVAGLLRDEGRTVSPAHVIEAVRLAGALAALRGRPLAGLTETVDAVRAVMCDGSEVPLALVRDRLVVGDVLGEVPDTAPAVPLQRDLSRAQRSLRLRPEAREREVELDLREENDAAKSRLLHRLRLLSVGWGEPVAGRGGTGTFRESWRLRWEPELYVRVAEAGVWGTTVVSAATARAEHRALAAADLAEVTSLAEECLLAGLTDALPVVMRTLADRAALDADVGRLAQALPALARSLRYGDVRSTDTAALAEVATGIAGRICVGLPPACAGLDADGAERMRGHLDAVHTATALLPDAHESAERWSAVLHRLASRDTVPGLIRGRAARLLLDDGRLGDEESARLMSRALSVGAPPADAAAWIEGFVGGSSGGGMLLLHDERLLALVDAWLTEVPAEAFTAVLPLLRRTFSAYEPGVRRTLGELVRRGPATAAGAPGRADTAIPGFGAGLHGERADAVLPVLRLILGGGAPGVPGMPGAYADSGEPGGPRGHGPAARRAAAGPAGAHAAAALDSTAATAGGAGSTAEDGQRQEAAGWR